MWGLKFKVKNIDISYTKLTEKYNVVDYFYPVDFYKKGKKFQLLGIHLVEGEEKEVTLFLKALKSHPKTKQFEYDGYMAIVLIEEEEKFYELIYDPSLYHPAPAIIKEGFEFWNIASWNRNKLEALIKEIEEWKKKIPEFELLSLKKCDFKDIYFPRILPQLPEQQKKAFSVALQKGYYNYPRKADLKDLAKIMGISISTYQEHLRRAEAKLLPFFAGHSKALHE